MSEIVVETQPMETVIELGDGTVVDTVVEQEVQTVVSLPAEPVVIDLNSGARGEPGSAVLAGPAYPTIADGVNGDVYIVTDGTIAVGNVYTKTDGIWVQTGNIRGPVGGINTINGYGGPDVELTKVDIGLEFVDNTTDLNKPISTATQAALDTTVKLTGNQTIAGVKTFTSSLYANSDIIGGGKLTLTSSSASIEIGRVDGSTSTPFIDFHSGATANDYDSRIIASGGNGTNGQGTLTYNALTHTFTGTISGNGSGLTSLNGSNISSGTVADARLSSNISRLNTAETITANKTFSSTAFLSVSESKFRVGTSTTARNVLMADASGYASWGNPSLSATQKNATDDASTYAVGLYLQETGTSTGWPVGLGTIQTSFINNNRAFQIAVDKVTSALYVRSADSGLTASGGWTNWKKMADDATVIHLSGTESITGAKTFTTNPIVPTPTAWNHAAHKQYVDDTINATIDAAPGTLDTLNELAAALGDDPNFATTVTNQIATKEPIINTGPAGTFYRADKTWAAPTPAQVGLGNVTNEAQVTIASNQTISGTKTFTPDTYFTGRIRATANTVLESQTDITLGSVAGDIQITRQHNHVGATNVWKIVDMMHRRAAGTDWSFTQMYTGVGVDTSFLASPTTGTSGTALKTWIRRDPQNNTVGIGSGVAEYLTLTSTAVTVGAGVVFTGNGSGLTTLNGSNVSSGTVADARLSTNVALLSGTQTFSGAKTFSSLITASAGVTVTGTVTATTFSGSGASLTSIPAGNLTGTIAQARLVQNIVRVEHGSTAGTARPTGSTYVEWVGSVVPTNMAAGDTWINTGTNGNTTDNYPSGAVMASASAKSTAPTGWYWMEGQEILISSDTALYNEVTNNGTTFPFGANTNGSGAAGSTHFRLPDGRGRTIHHATTALTRRANNVNGAGSTPFGSIGSTGGGIDAILITAQLPLHNHGVNDPGHAHNFKNSSYTFIWGIGGLPGSVYIDPGQAIAGNPPSNNLVTSQGYWSGTDGAYTGITTQNAGSGHPHDVLQPFITLRWMIKR